MAESRNCQVRPRAKFFKTLLLACLLVSAVSLFAERQGRLVFAAEQTQAYITTRDVNVRSGPGTHYKILTEIKEGTKVNVAGREGEWLRVVSKVGNPPGYIHEQYARPAGEPARQAAPFLPGSYITTADTFVREGPGLHYKVVAQVPRDIKVQVVGAEGDWLKVQSKRGRPPGYIDSRHARRSPG
ncbi:MAG: SH3 domain-containing protein [Candidatus Binatia bacterium]